MDLPPFGGSNQRDGSGYASYSVGGEQRAGSADVTPLELSCALAVDPAKQSTSVQGKLEGPGVGGVRSFTHSGIRGEIKLRVTASLGTLGAA